MTCVSNACVLVCEPGRGDCNGDPSDGCETALRSPLHCGACATACSAPAHAVSRCGDAGCAFSCEPGFGDCDGDPANGCEADLGAVATCGRCDTPCLAPEGTSARCEGGACQVRCAAGRGDCDGDPANGCEAELAATPAHCGPGGSACAAANGVAGCAAGRCTLARRDAGLGDCDADPGKGS